MITSSANFRRIRSGLSTCSLAAILTSVLAVHTIAQASVEGLKVTLNSQYATIERTIRQPPSPRQYPVPAEYNRHLREWQDDLAQAFLAAANTVQEILKLNPPNQDYWQDRLETLQLYGQPISSPNERLVFGASEMNRPARILKSPAAEYTDEARARKIHGDVRLRLVLAADGTVKYVFPIKSLTPSLAESAMAAARRIEFEVGIRNGKKASQFVTLVYEFKDGESREPYIPRTIF